MPVSSPVSGTNRDVGVEWNITGGEKERADGKVRGGETCVHWFLSAGLWDPSGTVSNCIREKPGFPSACSQVSKGKCWERHHGGRLKKLTEAQILLAQLCHRKVRDLKIQPTNKEEVGPAGAAEALPAPLGAGRRGSWPGCWSHPVVTLAVLPAQNILPSPDSSPIEALFLKDF